MTTSIIMPRQTNIIHSVRKALGISYEEYVIADAINFICAYKENRSGAATGKYREAIADVAGVSLPTVQRAISKLIEKGLVKPISRQSIEITSKWQEALASKTSYSYQNDTSAKSSTHIKMIRDLYQNDTSAYIIYTQDTQDMSKLPVLTNFSTTFSNGFSVLVFEASSESLTDSSKISQKGARGVAKDKNSAKGAAVAALFAEFWAEYPRKEKKAAAQTKYKKLAPKHKDIMTALAVYRQKTENTETQYIKLPTTFLTDYEDYLPQLTGLLDAADSSKISQKGAPTAELDKELEAAKDKLRVLAAAIHEAYPDTEAKMARVQGSAFELLSSDGKRIFDDKTAAMVEEMGGTWAAILELGGPHFDARAAMAWQSMQTQTA